MKVGLATELANRPMAEQGVIEAYKVAGLEPPRHFFWLGSPLAGALLDTAMAKLSATEPPPAKARETTVYPPRIFAVVDSVRPILDTILSTHNIPARIDPNFLVDCLSDLQLHNAAYGQHDASILCFYDFFAQVCGVEECKKLEGLNNVAKSCGWWWAYDSVAVLTERPRKLSLDDRARLHSDSDWSILYPDGFGYTLVHGVEVPEHVVLDSSKITVKEIEGEQNVEVRRVMIEKYGQSRYLLDSGAAEIQKDDWGTLYHKDVPDDEPIRMVKVVNSTPEPDGSFKDYFIRVSPNCQTALEAVAWTFEQTPEEYKNVSVQT